MASGWLEPRTRVPFAGIFAMVLIVAVVSLFLRAGLEEVLPESEVNVQGVRSTDGNLQGSSTFRGSRQAYLTSEQFLAGVLVTNEGSLGLTVNPLDQLLILEHNGLREEVVLELTEDSLGLSARFEYEGEYVTVTIFPAEHLALWHPAGGLAVRIRLVDATRYAGEFLFNGITHEVTVDPGVPNMRIEGASSSLVPLAASGTLFTGTWHAEGAQHPVELDLDSMLLSIENLW